MKNLGWKFIVVFLGGMGFSLLISTFAATISVTTDFNTATQYLKKIILLDSNGNNQIEINGNSSKSIFANGDIQSQTNIYAENFCKNGLGTDGCVNIKNDVLDKFSSLERELKTKAIRLNEYFDFNYTIAGMSCDADNEGSIIYDYEDTDRNIGHLYLCKKNGPNNFVRKVLDN